VRNEFFKESQALVLMFDITKKATFDALDMWLREASKNGGENLPVFVVGNKSDLAGNRKV
jgi:DnaJ family protein C protein 27